ncbi:MAG: hydrogenase 3 maturation endopeptidase HyCI [Candidatus Omnitrophica bacterium]|nr:hydrogenase 3 maturation endopeptidase HyCI [Candidatus Omnitrophota bacterium]MBU4589928.1 hydrogenase 3 maturation endopeptidase HyCI [Candidatus Omnitrophota bacterium]
MLNLKSILKGKVIILCIGNRDMGDDGVGPYLADEMKGKTSYEVIDAGVTPENYTGVITKLKPDTIIIVDTVQFEGNVGEARLFSGDDLRTGKISTHDVSPKLLIDFLKSSTNACIHILGIKPKSNNLGEGLSDAVKKTAKELSLHFLH